jgi:hypothetical protein
MEQALPSVYHRIENAKTFHADLLKKYPQARKPLTIHLPKRNKTVVIGSGIRKPTAFYICDAHNKLVAFDEDGTRQDARSLERSPDQCIILSNGCIVQSYAGNVYNNLVISTFMDETHQVISLPEAEDVKSYTLMEFPKNHVCIYRSTQLFIFDPLNPFTTNRTIEVKSTFPQQFEGNLYLWNANTIYGEWVIRPGDLTKAMSVVRASQHFYDPKWISSHQFVALNQFKQIGIYCTKSKLFGLLQLTEYANNKLGRCMYITSKNYVLVAQWPSWDEQSFDVRLTVFCIEGMDFKKVYENLQWFNNKQVGTAPIYSMIGGFSWPYLQKFLVVNLTLSIDNLETNKNIGRFKCNVPVKCDFVGDHLAVVTNPMNSSCVRIPLRETEYGSIPMDLPFTSGRMFRNTFSPEKLSIVITPDSSEDIKVEEQPTDDQVIEETPPTNLDEQKQKYIADALLSYLNDNRELTSCEIPKCCEIPKQIMEEICKQSLNETVVTKEVKSVSVETTIEKPTQTKEIIPLSIVAIPSETAPVPIESAPIITPPIHPSLPVAEASTYACVIC